MIYINNKEKIEKLNLSKENFYVVADFDKTLTKGNSNSTWAVMANAGEIDSKYIEKRTELYNYYRPIEIDFSITDSEKSKYMEEWWKKHISLFFEYGLEESNIKSAVPKSGLEFREGAKEFLINMENNNIPVIIISAGIGNVISEFLKNQECYFDNIHIISNFIEFKDNIIKGVVGDVIHALNKNAIKLSQNIRKKLRNKEKILLLGDGLADLKMVSKEDLLRSITVGFLDEKIDENLEYFNKEFDIVITNQGSFYDLDKAINRGG